MACSIDHLNQIKFIEKIIQTKKEKKNILTILGLKIFLTFSFCPNVLYLISDLFPLILFSDFAATLFDYLMDLSLQYRVNYDDDTIHDLEQWLGAAGLSLVNIMMLIRDNPKAPEALAQKLGRSVAQCTEYVKAVQKMVQDGLRALGVPEVVKQLPNVAIPTGLPTLDRQLHGGCVIGQVTEVFGASGTGKSQFLLNIAMQSQRLTDDNGKSLECVYIGTESPLETRRLVEMAADGLKPDLSKIAYIHCTDAETQDHIMFTQLPAKLSESNGRVALVIIDSISHHLRASETYLNSAEFLREHLRQQEQQFGDDSSFARLKSCFDAVTNDFFKADKQFRLRSAKEYYLLQLYRHLEYLARTFKVAMVVSNQVSDVVRSDALADFVSETERHDPLNYDFQVGMFSGWDVPALVGGNESNTDHSLSSINTSFTNIDSSSHIPSILQDQPIFEGSHYNRRRRIPALGYIWAKLIPRKILLWKTYVKNDLQPAKRLSAVQTNVFEKVTNSDRFEIEKSAIDEFETKLSSPSHSLILKRFARVVSPTIAIVENPTSCSTINSAIVEFIILQKGIMQIT